MSYDPKTKRPKGFGFVTFVSEDSLGGVLSTSRHSIGGKLVEVTRNIKTRDTNPATSVISPVTSTADQSKVSFLFFEIKML